MLFSTTSLLVYFTLVLTVRAELAAPPLTKLRTLTRCHYKTSVMELECSRTHRIRILESYYGVHSATSSKKACEDDRKDFINSSESMNDCKSYVSFQNECNGKHSCRINFHSVFLGECNSNSHYLTILYECVPESRIHNVCSSLEDFNSWGTLETTNFPQPQSSEADCWCRLVAENAQRIVLSVISFHLATHDSNCTQAGLYLQSDRKRRQECTILHQGHYYISSSQNLFLNFYSRQPNAYQRFWLIYEASDGRSRISLKCGDEVKPLNRNSSGLASSSSSTEIMSTSITKRKRPISILIDKLVTATTSTEMTFSYENLYPESSKESMGDQYEDENNSAGTNNFFFTQLNRKKLNSSTIKWISSTKRPVIDEVNLKNKSALGFQSSINSIMQKVMESNKKTTSHVKKPPSYGQIDFTDLFIQILNKKFTPTAKINITKLFTTESTTQTTTTTIKTTTRSTTTKTTPARTWTTKTTTKKTKTTTTRTTTPRTTTTTTTTSTTSSTTPSTTSTTTETTTTSTTTRLVEEKELPIEIEPEVNQTEFTSSAAQDGKQLMTTRNDDSDAKSAANQKRKRLTKTELVIIITSVAFIALLTLVNLLVYVFKKTKHTNEKLSGGETSSTDETDNSKKPYDILPGVGEIVLWAAKDKRGYLIDTNGSWAKIDSQRWLKENVNALQNTCRKASMAYKSKFRKRDEKKSKEHHVKKMPLKNKIYSLPPVSETTEYDNTSSSSSSLNDHHFIESDYHIEHGHINSPSDDKKLLESSIKASFNNMAFTGGFFRSESINKKVDCATQSSTPMKNKPYESASMSEVTSSSSDLDSESIAKRPLIIKNIETASNSPNQSIEIYHIQSSNLAPKIETQSDLKSTSMANILLNAQDLVVAHNEQNTLIMPSRIDIGSIEKSRIKLDPMLLKYSQQAGMIAPLDSENRERDTKKATNSSTSCKISSSSKKTRENVENATTQQTSFVYHAINSQKSTCCPVPVNLDTVKQDTVLMDQNEVIVQNCETAATTTSCNESNLVVSKLGLSYSRMKKKPVAITSNDSGFLDESSSAVDQRAQQLKQSSQILSSPLYYPQPKCSKMRFKKLKSLSVNPAASRVQFENLDDSGVNLDQRRSGLCGGTSTQNLLKEESEVIMCDKKMAWSAEDLNMLRSTSTRGLSTYQNATCSQINMAGSQNEFGSSGEKLQKLEEAAISGKEEISCSSSSNNSLMPKNNLQLSTNSLGSLDQHSNYVIEFNNETDKANGVYKLILNEATRSNQRLDLETTEQRGSSPTPSERNLTLAQNAVYKPVSIDREDDDEDTPIVMKNLHSVKSLKKFFEIKAYSKLTDMGFVQPTIATQQPNKCNMAKELKYMPSNASSSTSTSNTITILEEMFNKNARMMHDGNKLDEGDENNDDLMDYDEENSCSPKPSTSESTGESNQTNRVCMILDEYSDQDQKIPVPPPLPEFFNSMSISATRHQYQKQQQECQMSGMMQCKKSRLHEKLIKEIHNKTLERSRRKDVITLDKHGNLVCRNTKNQVYTVTGSTRQRVPPTSAELVSDLRNTSLTLPQANNQSTSFLCYRQRNASFRSDFSVRSTGSGCSSRSMLSEARAKLEAYSNSNRARRPPQMK